MERVLESVPISALEHTSYCPRQCALIHIEGVFDENIFTLRGHHAHERVDQAEDRWERGRTILRALPVWSERYGLQGRCDSVEREDGPPAIYRPVEYKSGRKRTHEHATLQAVAQAMCLEEMFDTTITEIALYFVASHERVVIPLDPDLRTRTIDVIEETRDLFITRQVPPPVADKRLLGSEIDLISSKLLICCPLVAQRCDLLFR
jgi:CRISPR-associated exonuclease Cas4